MQHTTTALHALRNCQVIVSDLLPVPVSRAQWNALRIEFRILCCAPGKCIWGSIAVRIMKRCPFLWRSWSHCRAFKPTISVRQDTTIRKWHRLFDDKEFRKRCFCWSTSLDLTCGPPQIRYQQLHSNFSASDLSRNLAIEMGVLRRQGPLINLSTDPAYYTWSVQPQLRAICLSLMILALVAVLTRVYIRIRILRVFRLDDYFIVLAMVSNYIDICWSAANHQKQAFSVASSCIFLHVVMLGMGRHIWAIPPHNLKPLLMYIFIVGVLVPLSVCFVKLSIAFFLFPLTKQTRFRQLLWAIIGRSTC